MKTTRRQRMTPARLIALLSYAGCGAKNVAAKIVAGDRDAGNSKTVTTHRVTHVRRWLVQQRRTGEAGRCTGTSYQRHTEWCGNLLLHFIQSMKDPQTHAQLPEIVILSSIYYLIINENYSAVINPFVNDNNLSVTYQELFIFVVKHPAIINSYLSRHTSSHHS